MKGLKIIHQALRDLLKENRSMMLHKLIPIAQQIELEAKVLVPFETGVLRDSIDVRVSRGPRYPGIIAVASAKNPKTGYDYATIQHEKPDYKHNEPEQYQYIAQPFNAAIERFMEDL